MAIHTAHAAPEMPNAGEWYIAFSPQLRLQQTTACNDLARAGDSEASALCNRAATRAADYLMTHARHSVIPASGWQLCSQTIQSDLVMGARCIAAVETAPACRVAPNGWMFDYQGCASIARSGAFLQNPAAQALSFSDPAVATSSVPRGGTGHLRESCAVQPYRDTPEAYQRMRAEMEGSFQPGSLSLEILHKSITSALETACRAKFRHGDRSGYYKYGIHDAEIDSLSVTQLATAWMDAFGR